MSLIVAIKDKDRIVVGADGQVSSGGGKDHSVIKIWPMKDLDGGVMGGVGLMRASQLLQYSEIVDKNSLQVEPTTEFVVCSLVPTIVATLKANGIPCEPDNDSKCTMIPNSFLFAYKDKAWMIWNDLSVMEIDEYLAIGSGSDVAKGVLFATKNFKNPFDRIVTAIQAAADTTLYVDEDVNILATGLRKTDAKQLAKALGVALEEFVEKPSEAKEEKQIEDDTKS